MHTALSATVPVFMRDCGTYLTLKVSKTRLYIYSPLFGIPDYIFGMRMYMRFSSANPRVFDTSVIKKVPLSLVIGLFFCQLFCFII